MTPTVHGQSADEGAGTGESPASAQARPRVVGRRALRTSWAVASPRAIAWRVYLAAAAVAALLLPLRHITLAGKDVDLTFALAAAALVAAHVAYSLLLRRSLQRHTYSWYVRAHAAQLPADSRLACRHCGGRHIVQHSLTGVNFLAQACADCKKTLFFRPERRAQGRRGRPTGGTKVSADAHANFSASASASADGKNHAASWQGPERRQSSRPKPPP